MKRLLLHVGYPKAASTTLQNGLFYELHKQKAINFLGRAFESGYFGARQTKDSYKEWFEHVAGNGRHDASHSIGELSGSLPNVFSEGLFMTNERRRQAIAGPDLLHHYFSPLADRIDVLVVIRKQADLIPSYYTQNYRKMQKRLFADYLAHHMHHGWGGEGKIFSLHDVVRAYAEVFGKEHVHVVLFEDLVNAKDRFSAQLGAAIGIDPLLVRAHLGEGHLNQTRKEADTIVIRKMNSRSPRFLLMRLLEKLGIRAAADSLRIRIPAVTAQEKNTIFEYFKAGNLQLAEEFSLDKHAMREYGYF